MLIKCPKCGKEYSEHAEKCPECGLKQVEIQNFRVEQKRKEEEAKQAEMEKRQERWQKNKKYLLWVICLTLIVVVGLFAFHIVNTNTKYQECLDEVTRLSKNKQFEDAFNQCQIAYNYVKSNSSRYEQLQQIQYALEDSINMQKNYIINYLLESSNYSSRIYMEGTINNRYLIHVTLRGNGGTNGERGAFTWIEGAYYYTNDKNGMNNSLTLESEMNIEGSHLVLLEYDEIYHNTGVFDGYIDGNIYEGNFIRASDGKRMPFRLECVKENNGTFIEI